MPYTREQIESNLIPCYKDRHYLIRGKKYLGREVPEGYFIVQDWILAQGVTSFDSGIPDLTHILQGVEYVFQYSTGKYPDVLTPQHIKGVMSYLNEPTKFENGALRQYPELQKLLKEELLKLPKGSEVINIIQALPHNQDLFT